jgi:hypothetical protein
MIDHACHLPDRYRELLQRYYCSFYRPLVDGERTPETEAQRHFVAACEGRLAPETVHEFAYTTFKKHCLLSGITEEDALACDFTFPDARPAINRSVAPPAAASPDFSGVTCPRCAAKGVHSLLVWRHARDPSVPGEFLGCSRYPHCHYKEEN